MVDHFLIWWLSTGRYSWSKIRRLLFERGYLRYTLPAVSSLEDIENCLKQVKWTMDGPLHLFDSISYPQVTWAKKKDDCDSFACLAAALLNQLDNNYSPFLVTVMVRPVQASHTVCAFSVSEETLWFFDNGSLRRVDCKTYADVANMISKRANRLVCWDVRNPALLDMIEFLKV
ncbi:transglutaminase-like domain-containing protein [Chloroflexota bacterium]